MTTWTDEQHERAQVLAGGLTPPGEDTKASLSDALDEIARLRAESARRMVWLETEQRAHEQTHAALVDMTERAAHPEITDDMVKRAGEALYENFEAQSPHWNYTNGDFQGATLDGGYDFETALRAALEAALNPGEGA